MNVLKNSSVAFAVGVLELTFEYRQIIEKTSQIIEITIVNLAIYLSSAVTVYTLANLFERRFLELKAIDRGHVASITEEGRNAT